MAERSPSLRILVVDDDRDIVYSIKSGLQLYGYKVDAFDRASSALECDSSNYDAAVVDIRMPEMSGFDLARRLWNQNRDLQICFLSAFEIYEKEAKSAFPSLFSHCFLRKPLEIGVLAKHIESHFVKA
jgi:two-component system catabolic regulation response regulator CreB/two-component system response regulator ChvI